MIDSVMNFNYRSIIVDKPSIKVGDLLLVDRKGNKYYACAKFVSWVDMPEDIQKRYGTKEKAVVAETMSGTVEVFYSYRHFKLEGKEVWYRNDNNEGWSRGIYIGESSMLTFPKSELGIEVKYDFFAPYFFAIDRPGLGVGYFLQVKPLSHYLIAENNPALKDRMSEETYVNEDVDCDDYGW